MGSFYWFGFKSNQLNFKQIGESTGRLSFGFVIWQNWIPIVESVDKSVLKPIKGNLIPSHLFHAPNCPGFQEPCKRLRGLPLLSSLQINSLPYIWPHHPKSQSEAQSRSKQWEFAGHKKWDRPAWRESTTEALTWRNPEIFFRMCVLTFYLCLHICLPTSYLNALNMNMIWPRHPR